MEILIVEDSGDVRGYLANIIEESGHRAIQASSGHEAIQLAEQSLPDLAIVDIYMPEMNGYQAGIKLKQLANERHLPVLFITASNKEQELVKSLEIGDDFIPKPIYPYVIEAKINAHIRTLKLYSTITEQAKNLQQSECNYQREHALVEKIFTKRFQQNLIDSPNLQYHISPKSFFLGDILLTVPSPTGGIYMAIGDVTGHGLPAAVAGLPAYRTFQTMAKKGIAISHIAQEMNKILLELLPDGMLIAATLLEINARGDQITAWSGGMPQAYITNQQGEAYHSIPSKHAPLGLLQDHEFSQDVQVVHLNQGDSVFLYTDGLIESTNAEGEMFGEQRIRQVFDHYSDDFFINLLSQFHLHIGSDQQDDDITVVEYTCQPFEPMEQLDAKQREQEKRVALPWQMSWRLTAEQLRKSEPVPQIIRLLQNAIGLDVHQDFISTILSELFNNALDHGLLKMDSALKATSDGFFEYYNLRSRRLKELQDGHITIDIEYQPDTDKPLLTITVQDSGSGFDAQAINALPNIENYGRGIAIIEELCQNLEYSNNGNTAKATYLIQ